MNFSAESLKKISQNGQFAKEGLEFDKSGEMWAGEGTDVCIPFILRFVPTAGLERL